MASTNKTTNYELSQFIETDRPAWLTDYNEDMRKLDTVLKAVSDVANGASGSISELADRMSTAEGNISTNANDIDALEARADSLEAQAQSTAGTIANIQTEQTAQNLGIEAATELGYNLARPYDSASTYAVGDYVLFQNTLYKCITVVPVGEAFDPTKWLAIKATDEIAAGGYTLPIASASTLGGVKIGDNITIDNGVIDIPTKTTTGHLTDLLSGGMGYLTINSVMQGALSFSQGYVIKHYRYGKIGFVEFRIVLSAANSVNIAQGDSVDISINNMVVNTLSNDYYIVQGATTPLSNMSEITAGGSNIALINNYTNVSQDYVSIACVNLASVARSNVDNFTIRGNAILFYS